eukprot:364535-Prorocentrum_minimum.AAC.1
MRVRPANLTRAITITTEQQLNAAQTGGVARLLLEVEHRSRGAVTPMGRTPTQRASPGGAVSAQDVIR